MPSTSSSESCSPYYLQTASRCVQSLTASILSHLPISALVPGNAATHITPHPLPPVPAVPIPLSASSPSSPFSYDFLGGRQNPSSTSSEIKSFSSSVRVDGLGFTGKGVIGGGPAFVGQVFSMLDSSGNGLMAVTTHFDIPFITRRVPMWVKKVLAGLTKNEENGPIFRFFMDLSDAVNYVKRVNVRTGMVGACRLDVAYEHFKAKPHMFEFVPNKEQVKAANRLLRTLPNKGGRKKVHGVPVFSADNLNIAIATAEGIKWYTPYFFDKNSLDNILEASVDQHFQTLIHNRHVRRRRDIVDDGLIAEIDNIDSLFEPPEVQEFLDETGHSGVPLSIISKAAEIQLLDVVDRVLLGNKWFRKAVGIQPKHPYLVDSFEERSAACFKETSRTNPQILQHSEGGLDPFTPDSDSREMSHQCPLGHWFSKSWSKFQGKNQNSASRISDDQRTSQSDGDNEINQVPANPLLPKITMVGVSMGEGSQISKANLKKTMEELTKELEQVSRASGNSCQGKDPLFVANLGDYASITQHA